MQRGAVWNRICALTGQEKELIKQFSNSDRVPKGNRTIEEIQLTAVMCQGLIIGICGVSACAILHFALSRNANFMLTEDYRLFLPASIHVV